MQTRPLKADETPSDLSRNGYNASAHRYLEWTTSLPSPRLVWLEKLLQRLGPSTRSTARVLELGCGAGVPCTLKLAQTVGQLVATDISSAQLDLARKHFQEAGISIDDGNGKCEFREADMLTLSFPNASFDAICAFYSFIQLSQPGQLLMLQRSFQWLRPGGYILLNVTKDPSEGTVMEDWLGMNAFWAGSGTQVTLSEMSDIGFEIVERETIETEGDAAFTWIIAKKLSDAVG